MSTIAVVDLDAEQLVWQLRGDFRFQHDPRLVDEGKILLFDNFGPALRGMTLEGGPARAKRFWYRSIFDVGSPGVAASAVIEIDPTSGRTVWSYEGTPDQPFSSKMLGAAHRLPNGNTLIIESQRGRAFEVSRAGEIVSPHRLGDLVASLPDLVRLPPDFRVDWMRDARSPSSAGPAN